MKGGTGFFDAPFTFLSRFEGAQTGTNPEELIGAAQAGCFSMFLAAQLTTAGHPPTSIETSATVELGAGPAITKISLVTKAVVPGVSKETFDEKSEILREGELPNLESTRRRPRKSRSTPSSADRNPRQKAPQGKAFGVPSELERRDEPPSRRERQEFGVSHSAQSVILISLGGVGALAVRHLCPQRAAEGCDGLRRSA